MSQPDKTAALRTEMRRIERKLNLVLEMDTIRDRVQEPGTMLNAIVNLLADEFDASLCLLILIDRDTGELELKSLIDRERSFGRISVESIKGLAQRALKAKNVDIWEGSGVCSAFGLPEDECRLQLAVVPIVMGEKIPLGALLIGRMDHTFEPDDIDLLRLAESQVDSAVMQSHHAFELDIRNKELETIYRVDTIRDKSLPFDEMLDLVLEELRGVIKAEMGFIMLYEQQTEKLELRAFSHDDLFKVTEYHDTIEQIANEAMQKAHLVYQNELTGQMNSVMAIPLILRDEILGVFGVANRGGVPFEQRERRLLTAIASQMDTAIFENLEQRRLKRVLGRSVDPRVMQRILENPDIDVLKGERQPVTVLFADIRGSTALAERIEPDLLVGFINDYLSKMVDVILKYEGTLDKFVGDEVMALFNAPFPQEDHAMRAVRVAFDMQQAHHGVLADWADKGITEAPIGVGIATGDLIVGEMGSPQRTDYTVIGRAANLGARICSVAAGGEVLISQETYDMVSLFVTVEPVEGEEMKGIGKVDVYKVISIDG